MAHEQDDADGSEFSLHHTLGPRPNQAARGTHIHNGEDSPKLMAGVVVTGSRGGNAAVASLITGLVNALGFTDATTP